MNDKKETASFIKNETFSKQPQLVCHSCGEKYGINFQLEIKEILSQYKNEFSTFNNGFCEVCLKYKAVTDPKDYGYLHSGWEIGSLVSKIKNY
jgi:hypothetical protein